MRRIIISVALIMLCIESFAIASDANFKQKFMRDHTVTVMSENEINVTWRLSGEDKNWGRF